MVEFYGELSEKVKKTADRLKRRYFAVWTFVLTLAVTALAVIGGVLEGDFIVFTVFAVILASLTAYLYFVPPRKAAAAQIFIRVIISEDLVRFVRYLEDGEKVKEKKISDIRRVVKTKNCYFLVFNDISNAIPCQRTLLKKGTFTLLEEIFKGKIREKEV